MPRLRTSILIAAMAGLLPKPSPDNPHMPKTYLPWENAGGPNECRHGYAEGIDCPRCDEEDRILAATYDPA